VNAPSAAVLRRLPPGDRAPFLAIIARRHLAALEQIGPQPRPAEPAGSEYRRRHHRGQLRQLQAVARMLGLTVSGVPDA
jgi:hypothetical protein